MTPYMPPSAPYIVTHQIYGPRPLGKCWNVGIQEADDMVKHTSATQQSHAEYDCDLGFYRLPANEWVLLGDVYARCDYRSTYLNAVAVTTHFRHNSGRVRETLHAVKQRRRRIKTFRIVPWSYGSEQRVTAQFDVPVYENDASMVMCKRCMRYKRFIDDVHRCVERKCGDTTVVRIITGPTSGCSKVGMIKALTASEFGSIYYVSPTSLDDFRTEELTTGYRSLESDYWVAEYVLLDLARKCSAIVLDDFTHERYDSLFQPATVSSISTGIKFTIDYTNTCKLVFIFADANEDPLIARADMVVRCY